MTERTQHGETNKRPSPASIGGGCLLLPDPSRPLTEQTPETLLAMCLFGEARGEPAAAKRAVAQVAVNRAKFPHPVFGSRSGAEFLRNLCSVLLQHGQFSCFLEKDPNGDKLLRPLDCDRAAVWQECFAAAQEAIAAHEQQDAFTGNSDHYFDESIQPPSWADPTRRTVQIGRLRFFRLYLPPSEAGAGAPPSPRESTPPQLCRSVQRFFRSRIAEAYPAALCRKVCGSGPHMSFPAPHHPSQRTPRLGLNRWFQEPGALQPFSRLRAHLRTIARWSPEHRVPGTKPRSTGLCMGLTSHV